MGDFSTAIDGRLTLDRGPRTIGRSPYYARLAIGGSWNRENNAVYNSRKLYYNKIKMKIQRSRTNNQAKLPRVKTRIIRIPNYWTIGIYRKLRKKIYFFHVDANGSIISITLFTNIYKD